MQTQRFPSTALKQKMKLYLYSKPAKRNRKRVGGKHSALRQTSCAWYWKLLRCCVVTPCACVRTCVRGRQGKYTWKEKKKTNLQNPNKLSTANSMNEENITKKQTNIIQQLSGAMVLIQKSIDNQFRTSLLSKTCYKKRKSK